MTEEAVEQEDDYLVTWTIDLYGSDPADAAQNALNIQRREDSIATVFTVKNKRTGKEHVVDLTEGVVHELNAPTGTA